MALRFDRAALARAGFFALLPAAMGAGGLAIAAISGMAGVAGADLRAVAGAATRHRTFLILLLCFIGWAVLSTAWTPYRDHGQALRLAVTAAGGLLFVAWGGGSIRAHALSAASIAAVLVAIILIGIEAVADMPLNRAVQPDTETWVLQRNPGRGVSVLVVVCWGALGALVGRGRPTWRIAAATLAVVVGFLSAQFDQQANGVAFGAGLIAAALGYAAPRFALIVISATLALWILAAPFLSPLLARQEQFVSMLPDTWAFRTEMWRFASERALEHPWIGIGLDGARTYSDEITVRGQTMHAIQLHPHSASLQIWLETGLIGAALAATVLIFAGLQMGRALRTNRVAAAAACGVIASLGVLSNVSFGAWQEWWIATAFVAAAMVAALATSAKA